MFIFTGSNVSCLARQLCVRILAAVCYSNTASALLMGWTRAEGNIARVLPPRSNCTLCNPERPALREGGREGEREEREHEGEMERSRKEEAAFEREREEEGLEEEDGEGRGGEPSCLL